MRLYCAISFHGFGHLAQSAPVINTLLQRGNVKHLVLHCDAPLAVLRKWFTHDFEHIRAATDLGTPMHNALVVDREATWQQFLRQDRNKADEVARCRDYLARSRPDLVLSNNSYLISRAARELGIRSFHFCSLNWADNFLAYCHDRPGAQAIYDALCADYNCAEAFIRLPPHMPMPGLARLLDVGPVCRTGNTVDLARHFGHSAGRRYLLVCLGGMPYPIDFARWPERDDLFVINGGAPGATHRSLVNIGSTGLNMIDLIASVDAIVTKPGYGIYMEAACSAKPLLYLPRGDWPEEPYLNQWQNRHAWAEPIVDAQLQSGNLDRALATVLGRQAREARPPLEPTGVAQVVSAVLPPEFSSHPR